MFTSHLPAFLDRLDLTAAAQAMGRAAVACVREQMLHGYPQPIRATGALLEDLSFVAEGAQVTIGNTLPYALPVHDGTSTLSARPYLTDGILGSVPTLQQAVINALR